MLVTGLEEQSSSLPEYIFLVMLFLFLVFQNGPIGGFDDHSKFCLFFIVVVAVEVNADVLLDFCLGDLV